MLIVRALNDHHPLHHSDLEKEFEPKVVDMLTFRRRRILQRHACLISVMIAFCFGLILGIFLPLFGYYNVESAFLLSNKNDNQVVVNKTIRTGTETVVSPRFPSFNDIRNELLQVSFVQNEISDNDTDGELREESDVVEVVEEADLVQGTYQRLPNSDLWMKKVVIESDVKKVRKNNRLDGLLTNDIFWGPMIETHLPRGFTKRHAKEWLNYLNHTEVAQLEPGCGRMQNRLVRFRDGSMACARYRQNTDQLQGELFSFYLGQLLNLTNLVPSAASVLDFDSQLWSGAVDDVTEAQWKKGRPVVLTKWVVNLEPAGIPKQFQPVNKHLNKLDVKNLTESLDRLSRQDFITKIVELAQWSDLIVFDYLIANLDRVVNNLYNHQWNADIMEAPAHNLAKQVDSNLLIFLDNESGLLHGYRLLKKYETYHGLLLDNLCIFRQSTINTLRQLRDNIGVKLNKLFEQTTSQSVRDVLPPLPDKSIKILVNRVDRVLDQVQKCRDTFATATKSKATTTKVAASSTLAASSAAVIAQATADLAATS